MNRHRGFLVSSHINSTGGVFDHSPSDFRYRCSEKMGRFGDAAMDSQQHNEAIQDYSAALSIHPADTPGFFILRSKICMANSLWEEAIHEAQQVHQFFFTEFIIVDTMIRQLDSIRHHHEVMR